MHLRPAALALMLVALTARQAQAHASLVSSAPASGAVVTTAPSFIRLVFSEPIVAELSHVMLMTSDHRALTLNVKSDPREVRAIIAPVSELAAGGYRVDWHIISADGHPVSGTFTFSVGSAAQPPPTMMHSSAHSDGHSSTSIGEPMAAGTALIPALLRGAALSALLALCGMLGFVAYGKNRTRSQERLGAWLSVAAVVLLLAHLVSWLVHISPDHSLDESVVRAALSREVGFDEMLRLILAALAAWALLLARQWKLAFALALAAVISGGMIGHPAAIEPLIAIPAKSLHLVGVAFWFGGILWLATIDVESPEMIPAATTVSSVALIAIVIVSVSGIVQAFLFLNSWSDLLTSAYGLALLGKVGGLIVLFAFGAYHRSRLMPVLGSDGTPTLLQRSIRREILVMIAVILLGGFLAYVPVPLHTT
ncbi:MAG TPA: copper resistance protein CopC [Gemmatimonadaceae bacterium]|nr:copper resistance protein CopC [Gemmatimonadaceae bacterium]